MQGWDKRGRSLGGRRVAWLKSKCSERIRMGELEEGDRIIAIKTGAVRRARERTVPKFWLWSEAEAKLIGGKVIIEVGVRLTSPSTLARVSTGKKGE